MSVIMHGPYLKQTQLLCVIDSTICEQPALVYSKNITAEIAEVLQQA